MLLTQHYTILTTCSQCYTNSMANWKGHLAGGVGAGFAVVLAVSHFPIEQLAEATHLLNDWMPLAAIFVICMLFGLFPDVDTNSKAQDIFFGIAFSVDVLLLWNGYIQAAAYLGFIAMLPIVSHHRGWTHSKIAMLAVPLPILVIPYLYSAENIAIAILFYIAAVAGYFSHLLLDGLIWRKIRIKN
jgi:membrane-bound metal-dependent hydrolase YbcI (DUF457 family)